MEKSDTSERLVLIAQLRRQLDGLMRIDTYEVLTAPDQAVAFRGQINGDVEALFEDISQRFSDLGYTAWLRDWEDGKHEVVVTKGKVEQKTGRVWVNVLLFLVTFFTALYIGAMNELDPAVMDRFPGAALLIAPVLYIYRGIPFAVTLMGILLAHELSHYFVGRLYGSPQSLPYFIPFPNLFGTMGAVILQRAPFRNRKAMLDIGVAGPLGGIILAIPLLVLGLTLSEVQPPPTDMVGVVIQEGNSLLYLGLKYLVFGRILPSDGVDVWLHPMAFAAWTGLLVTMINLIPVGQLDGGHISYALLGRRSQMLGYGVIGAMIGWGGWLLFNGNQAGGFWVTWGILNLMLNRRHPQPADSVTRLNWARIALGLFVLLLFVVLVMPAPLRQVAL